MAHNSKKIEKQGFHHGNLKDSVIAIAYEKVIEEGVEALNLRKLAAECGVDHSALYRHFKNKNALISEIVLRGLGQLNKSLNCNESISAAKHLAGYIKFAFQSPNIYSLIFSEQGRKFYKDPEIQAEIQKLIHVSAIAIGEISPEEKINSDLRDRVMRAWAFTHGFIELWQNRLFKAKTPELAEQYILQQVKIYLEINKS